MGLVADTLDELAAGTITAKQAVIRLMDGGWHPNWANESREHQERVIADSWDEVEHARASHRISEGDYRILRIARDGGLFLPSRRPSGPAPQWMLDLEARIAREEAEDRRTPDVPGKRPDIRAYPGFASGGATPREWSES